MSGELFPMHGVTPAEALHWAIRRAEDAEDRAARFVVADWRTRSQRTDEIAAHATAVERVHALRAVVDQLGIEQPPPRPRHPDLPALYPQEVGTTP